MKNRLVVARHVQVGDVIVTTYGRLRVQSLQHDGRMRVVFEVHLLGENYGFPLSKRPETRLLVEPRQ